MFVHISLTSTAHEEAFAELLGRSPSLSDASGCGRWSFAELGCTEADIDWLRNWAAALTPLTVRVMLSESGYCLVSGKLVPAAAPAGALILLLFSETSRRRAAEGRLWPLIHGAKLFSAATMNALFNANRYPNRPLLMAIKAAVSALNLRNAFDDASFDETKRQQYYLTIFLQFGFSEPAIRQCLRRWLQGQRPWASVEILLGLAGRQDSRTFRNVWSIIRRLALGHVREAEAREQLAVSPWLLPAWLDQIVRETSDAVATDGEDVETPASDHAATEPDFLSDQSWRWRPNEQPRIICTVKCLDDPQLTEDHYDVIIGGAACARLVAQESGYSLRRPSGLPTDLAPAEIELTCSLSPQLEAELVNEVGNVVRHERLNLWDAFSAVSVFQLIGGRAEPVDANGTLNTDRAYGLVVWRDTRLVPTSQAGRSFTSDSFTFHTLEPGWAKTTQVCQGERVLWQPRTAASASKTGDANSDREIHAEGEIRGLMLRVSIWHRESVKVRYVWCAGQEACNFQMSANRRCTTCFLRRPDLPDPCIIEIHVGLGSEKKELRPVRLKVATGYQGCVRSTRRGREAIDDEEPIYVHELAQQRLEFVTPTASSIDPPDWFLLEEGQFLGPVNSRRKAAALADRTPGCGGRVYLQAGKTHGPEPFQVAGAIIDGGVFDPSDPPRYVEGSLSAAFSNRYTVVAESHRVVIWTVDDELVSRKIGTARTGDDRCAVEWDAEGRSVRAVALWRAGVRTGATWSPTWHRGLARASAEQAHRWGAIVRWMRLPVLEHGAERTVHRLIEQHGVEVLASWLQPFKLLTDESDICLHDDAALQPLWLATVRESYRGWRPRKEEVSALVIRLGEPHATKLAEQAAWAAYELSRIDAYLAVRVFEAFARGCLSSPRERREATAGARAFLLDPRQSTHLREPEQLQSLVHQCATFIGNRGEFAREQVYEACTEAASSWRQSGFPRPRTIVDLVGQNPAGRRLLAWHILATLNWN